MRSTRALAQVILIATIAGCGSAEKADLILTGARVWTGDSTNVTAEAIAVRGERIIAVGTSAEMDQHVGPETRRIELDGRFIPPGSSTTTHTLVKPVLSCSALTCSMLPTRRAWSSVFAKRTRDSRKAPGCSGANGALTKLGRWVPRAETGPGR